MGSLKIKKRRNKRDTFDKVDDAITILDIVLFIPRLIGQLLKH